MSNLERNDNKTLYSYSDSSHQEMAKSIAQTLYRFDRIADQRLSQLEDLNEEHVKLFWEQGYLVVDHVYRSDEIETAIAAIMDVVYGISTGSKVQFVKSKELLVTNHDKEMAARKIYEYIDHEPRLRNLAEHPELIRFISRLLNEKPKIVQDMAILKPPSGGAEKPWHQDMAYGALAFDQSVIGVWTALDPAELDNGCMHVIPYSHRNGGVPHYAERDWQICDRNVQVDQDVAVPLKPGAALFFSGLLHHGSPPNFSDKRRRALQIHYAPESATKLSAKEYKQIFTNKMTNAQC
jgi:phytanoyl-CoA hydroxylase